MCYYLGKTKNASQAREKFPAEGEKSAAAGVTVALRCGDSAEREEAETSQGQGEEKNAA